MTLIRTLIALFILSSFCNADETVLLPLLASAAPANPAFSSATINDTAVVINWNVACTQGSGYNDNQLDLDGLTAGNDIGLTYVSGDGTAQWTYTAASGAANGDTVDLDFDGTANSIENSLGVDLGALTSESVQNNTPGGCADSEYATNTAASVVAVNYGQFASKSYYALRVVATEDFCISGLSFYFSVGAGTPAQTTHFYVLPNAISSECTGAGEPYDCCTGEGTGCAAGGCPDNITNPLWTSDGFSNISGTETEYKDTASSYNVTSGDVIWVAQGVPSYDGSNYYAMHFSAYSGGVGYDAGTDGVFDIENNRLPKYKIWGEAN